MIMPKGPVPLQHPHTIGIHENIDILRLLDIVGVPSVSPEAIDWMMINDFVWNLSWNMLELLWVATSSLTN